MATTNGGKVTLQVGPGRGKVDVLVGGAKQKTIKTDAKKAKLKSVAFSGSGIVTLKVRKGGKGVYVDALVLDVMTTPPTTPPPTTTSPGPPASTVIITEVMTNPSAVADTAGEYLELHNVSAATVTLTGCTITTQATATVTLPAATMPPGTFYVLARSTDFATNGGVPANTSFSFTLSASGSLTLACGGPTLDTVAWTTETAGKSRSLDPDKFSAVDNDNDVNWCPASSMYGAGDFGTPAAINGQCP